MQQLSLFDQPAYQPPPRPVPPPPLIPIALADWSLMRTPARYEEPSGWALWHRPTGLETRAFARPQLAIDEAYRVAVFFEWLPVAELEFQWHTNRQWFHSLPDHHYYKWWHLVLRNNPKTNLQTLRKA